VSSTRAWPSCGHSVKLLISRSLSRGRRHRNVGPEAASGGAAGSSRAVGEESEEAMKKEKKTPKAKGKVVKFTARRREAMDLVKFVDAHGGRLAPLRGYRQVRPPSTPA
jgi:hypothetical protein